MTKLLSAVAALAIASGASAAVVYSTGFENPPFTTGNITGKDSWITQGANATITNNAANAHTGNQYVAMTPGTSGQWHWRTANQLTAAQCAASPILTTSIWLSTVVGTGAGLKLGGYQLYDTTGNTVLAAIYLQTDGSIVVSNGVTSAATAAGTVTNMLTYHKLGIELNYSTLTSRFFFDNVELITSPGFGVIGANDFGDMDLYASRPTGSVAGGAQFRFDDLSIANDIPAPGALALVGLGGIIAGRRRRA